MQLQDRSSKITSIEEEDEDETPRMLEETQRTKEETPRTLASLDPNAAPIERKSLSPDWGEPG